MKEQRIRIMKELSTVEKAKRYDEAIEELRGLLEGIHEEKCDIMEEDIIRIFPELKESEDEKIMKAIITLLNTTIKGKKLYSITDTTRSEMLAWLEKQGEQKPFDYEDANVQQKDFAPKSAMGAIKAEKIDNANKVEPKFKVGDWIANKSGLVQQVLDFRGGIYTCTYNSFTTDCESNYHLYTIQDAKDGDVLVCESGERTLECLFIFKLIADREVHEYCSYRTIDKHFSLKDSFLGYVDNVYHPATKEQRDTLEKAMADAGYTFDFEKKELKKIEQHHTWNKKDEEMLKSIIATCEFVEQERDSSPARHLFEMQDNWLKSLKDRVQPQNTWKPSEEQVNALEHFVRSIGESGFASLYEGNTNLVYSLLSELKKLKG